MSALVSRYSSLSASHATVLSLISQATSEPMEMSGVVYGLQCCATLCKELSCWLQIHIRVQCTFTVELPPNAAGDRSKVNVCPHQLSLDTEGCA